MKVKSKKGKWDFGLWAVTKILQTRQCNALHWLCTLTDPSRGSVDPEVSTDQIGDLGDIDDLDQLY